MLYFRLYSAIEVVCGFYGILAVWREEEQRKGWCVSEHLFLSIFKIQALLPSPS